MCGLVGIATKLMSVDDIEKVRNMTASLAHRGPDSEGFFNDENTSIGFKRLSIIDVDNSDQPLKNKNGTVWCVMNGEIYNYREIRSELSAKGYQFKTSGDGEAIIALYEMYGERFAEKLRGMFAFCVYDKQKGKIILGRDRIGIKPLLYVKYKDGLAFASELKALVAGKVCETSLDLRSLDNYLYYQFVPDNECIYSKIKKVKPGSIVVFNLNTGEVAETEYWDLFEDKHGPTGLLEYTDYERVLDEAIDIHLRSDLPVGAFLSGGLDSSLLVAKIATSSRRRLSTFSIDFDEPDWDESEYSRYISRKYHTDHHSIVVTEEDLRRSVDNIFSIYDEPFADSSTIPTYFVSRLASESVKVVVSGDGADETLGGYHKYKKILALQKYNILRRLCPGNIGATIRSKESIGKSLFTRIVKYADTICSSDVDRHLFYMSFFRQDKRRLFNKDFYREGIWDNRKIYERHYLEYNDLLKKMLYADTKVHLPGDILYKVDIASMANSLEVRIPYLDHHVVEKAFSMDSSHLIGRYGNKSLLKEIALQYFPEKFVFRKKMGFEIPVSKWLRGRLYEDLRETIFDSDLMQKKIFDDVYIGRLLDDHRTGRQDYGSQLWTLYALFKWNNHYPGTLTI